MPYFSELLFCFCQVDLGCISSVDSSCELVYVVADATKLRREFVEAIDNNARLYQSRDYVIYVIAGASYDGKDAEAENKLAVSEYAKIDEVIKSVFGKLPKNSAVVPEDNGGGGGLIVPDDNDMPVFGEN